MCKWLLGLEEHLESNVKSVWNDLEEFKWISGE